MIDHTDQLVVATTTRDDHAEAGALLLEALAQQNDKAHAQGYRKVRSSSPNQTLTRRSH